MSRHNRSDATAVQKTTLQQRLRCRAVFYRVSEVTEVPYSNPSPHALHPSSPRLLKAGNARDASDVTDVRGRR